MSYLVLARKYRPKQFSEVVGQAHVAQTLQNALAAGKVAHAYLFAGPRGVGKTTTARILAKALNCVQGPTPTPCDACDQCTEITRGVEVMDVFEIDAASNRGIDEIRELRDTVKYAPAHGRYKVYIIDEAHQITHDAFNALLKTLEEPPPHVVFVLCTTEGPRIPSTILSRCQRFRFRPVPRDELIQQLQRIVQAEGFTVENAALERIADAATGSLRDAVSLLDQGVSFAPEGVKVQDIEQLIGVLPEERLQEFAQVLARKEPRAVLQVIEKVVGEGWDLAQFVRDARGYFRQQLVTAATVSEAGAATVSEAGAATVSEAGAATVSEAGAATQPNATSNPPPTPSNPPPTPSNPPPTPSNPPPTPWSIPELLRVLRVLSQCQEEMRWQDAQRTVLELHALRLTQPFVELGDVIQRVEQLEARINRSQPHEVGEPLPPTAVSPEPPSPPPLSLDRLGAPNPEGSPATGDWLGWVRERWDKIRHELWKRPGVASVFDAARLEAASESELSILFREAFHVEQAKRNLSFIEDTVAQVTGRRFRVQCQQGDVPEPQETFVVVPEEDSLQETMVKADEGVRKVLRHFPGTIRPKSSASETTP